MACILFAWELGTNLGHVAQLVPLAEELRARGHRPVFALSDVTRAEKTLAPHKLEYLQAPVWHPRLPRLSVTPCSYAEILHHYGYLDEEGLLGMVKAWRQIYRLLEPDVLLFEHAPTALLASRGYDAVRLLCGVGFSSPPRVQPFPNFRSWEAVSAGRLERSEALALKTVNAVLRKLKLRGVRALHELFDVDEDFLCTFRELDHYTARLDAQYCGSIFTREVGARAEWPHEGNQRLFVYMRPDMPAFHPLAEELRACGDRVLWVAPGIDEATVQRYRNGRVAFAKQPVRLSEVAAQAEAAVLYGGHGTVSAMLLAGVPVAIFPTHVEQALVSERVLRLGAGISASAHPTPDEIRATCRRVLDDSQISRGASAFSARYPGHDPQAVVSRIASRIEAHCKNAMS